MKKNENGNFSILGGFFIFLSILFLIFILDYGTMIYRANSIQDTAETAALAGVKQLDKTLSGKNRAIETIKKMVEKNDYSASDIEKIEFGNYVNNNFIPSNSLAVNSVKVTMKRTLSSPFAFLIGQNTNFNLIRFSTAEGQTQNTYPSEAVVQFYVNKNNILNYNKVSCDMEIRVPVLNNSCHTIDLNIFETNENFRNEKLKINGNILKKRFIRNDELIEFSNSFDISKPILVAVYEESINGYSYTRNNKIVGFSMFNISKQQNDYVYTLSCNNVGFDKISNIQFDSTNSVNNFGLQKSISQARVVK